jgi:hypothetical protein
MTICLSAPGANCFHHDTQQFVRIGKLRDVGDNCITLSPIFLPFGRQAATRFQHQALPNGIQLQVSLLQRNKVPGKNHLSHRAGASWQAYIDVRTLAGFNIGKQFLVELEQ